MKLLVKISYTLLDRPSSYIAVFSIILICFSCGSNKRDESSLLRNLNFLQLADKVNMLAARSGESPIKTIDSLYISLHNPTIEDLCNKYLTESYYSQVNTNNEERYADSTLVIIRDKGLEKKLPLIYGRALRYKGRVLMKKGEYNVAYNYYNEGLQAVSGTADTVDFFFDLGSICSNQGYYLRAVYYFKECLKVYYKRSNDGDNLLNFYFLASDYNHLGLCYDQAGMADTAIRYYNAGLDFIAKHECDFNDRIGAKVKFEDTRAMIYENLGAACAHKENSHDAEIFFRKSIAINKNLNYRIEDTHITQLKLVELYLQTLRLEEARNVLDTLAIETDSVRDDPYGNVAIEWYRLKSDYYNLSHDIPDAYAYITLHNTHKDSADKITKQLVSIDFNDLVGNIKEKNSMQAMEAENKMNNLNVMVAIVFFVLLITIGVFISKKNKQLESSNEKISLQNAEMQQTLGALEQSQQENMRMMEMVAHDLRNPVSALMSITSLLLEEEQDKKTQKEFLTLMHTSEASLLEMITGILSGNIALADMEKQDVDMKALLEYCVDLLKFKAADKKQSIKLDAEEIILKTDREKIWRIMSNLITNAIKFSSENTDVEVGMHKKGETIRISVKDSGIGIPADMQDKLFELYNDKGRIGTRGERSFGLGLFISKRIVEVLGGKIWFESAEGLGTIFYIEFSEQQSL